MQHIVGGDVGVQARGIQDIACRVCHDGTTDVSPRRDSAAGTYYMHIAHEAIVKVTG
ncbi:hypothetical protein GCM10022249_22210 [Enteractinococcus coprophilus]